MTASCLFRALQFSSFGRSLFEVRWVLLRSPTCFNSTLATAKRDRCKLSNNEGIRNMLSSFADYKQFIDFDFDCEEKCAASEDKAKRGPAAARIAAYRNAAAAIATYPDEIVDVAQVRTIKGVGPRIAEKIGRYLALGEDYPVLKMIREDEMLKAVKDLCRVDDIGPQRAKQLITGEFAIKSIYDLRAKKDALTGLSNAQRLSLEHLEDFELGIPREEMVAVEKLLLSTIARIDPKYKAILCGGFRRNERLCKSLKLVLTHDDLDQDNKNHYEDIVFELQKSGFIEKSVLLNSSHFKGVCCLQLPSAFNGIRKQIQISCVQPERFWCNVVQYTGSLDFVIALRSVAHSRGFTLNEFCIRKGVRKGKHELSLGGLLPVTCEEDVFRHIGLPFIKPEERDGFALLQFL